MKRLALTLLLIAGAAAAKTEAPTPVLPGAEAFPPELTEGLDAALAAKGPSYLPRTHNLDASGAPLYTNRLLLESSPYLQQHAHNPVNWYPWGDEAFATARRLGRPVLVSIGYSTCHWCHVMEEESFDDPLLAEYLNQNFIAIKVDRESRPDIDSIYMSAIHAMGERGGWPLNVWVTPDRKPFFAGTYFPPSDRGGRRSFKNVLEAIAQQWAQDPKRFEQFAERLAGAIRDSLERSAPSQTRIPTDAALVGAARFYQEQADREWGGLRQRIKFPSSLPVRFLLRYHRRSGDADALAIAVLSLDKMAAGGIWDHVGGGFHRYSTDPKWLVPHFEKMLYDNALLAVAYLEGGQVTGRADLSQVTRDILDYVRREMRAPQGGFYSATDADSLNAEGEREEGWYFTWTVAELDAALPKQQAAAVKATYGVTDEGNFEGRNILHAWRDRKDVARELGSSEAELDARLDAARARLYELRALRPAPLRDDKILAGWNGLMISAFAQAGFVLNEPTYIATAERAADFVLGNMRADGRLQRVYQNGVASGPAFLEDYAFVIAALLDLYEASAAPRWLREAIALQAVLDRHYSDPKAGAYFKTAADQEKLIAREKPGNDGALPSGNSIALQNLLRLAEFTGDAATAERAALAFSSFAETLEQRPAALSEMLLALDYQLDSTLEIVLVSGTGARAPEALLAPLRSTFVPSRIVAVTREGEDLEGLSQLVPLVKGKLARAGRPTAYVCENRVCAFPTSDPETFAEQLRKPRKIE